MSTPEPIARITPTTRYSGGCDKLEGAEVGIKDGGGDMSGSVAGVRYWRIGSGNIDIREQIEILPLMRRLWETSVGCIAQEFGRASRTVQKVTSLYGCVGYPKDHCGSEL